MCTPALPRSRIGGANCDASTITLANLSIENDSGTRTKRTTLKRCTKEDDIINVTRLPLKHMNLESISSDESQDDFNLSPTLTGTSSPSFATLRLLRTVRRHLGPLESPVPRKATSREAGDGHTGPRGRKHSWSFVELDPALQTTSSEKSPRKSKGFGPLNTSSQSISTFLSQNNTSREYALEDLNMKVCCYERHVTTWDVPDWACMMLSLATITDSRIYIALLILRQRERVTPQFLKNIALVGWGSRQRHAHSLVLSHTLSSVSGSPKSFCPSKSPTTFELKMCLLSRKKDCRLVWTNHKKVHISKWSFIPGYMYIKYCIRGVSKNTWTICYITGAPTEPRAFSANWRWSWKLRHT